MDPTEYIKISDDKIETPIITMENDKGSVVHLV
jgi:hypothetical protein